MVKQDCLLVLTLVWYQIIGCNGEGRLSARTDPCVMPDYFCNGEAGLSARANPCWYQILAVMLKQESLLVLTLVWYQIIACNG